MRRHIFFQLCFTFLQILWTFDVSSAALISAGNGTVADTANNLVWLSNTNCFGVQVWNDSSSKAKNLSNGQCGLTDNSKIGDWRLPTPTELGNMNTSTTDNLVNAGFSNIQSGYYWTSKTTILTQGLCTLTMPVHCNPSTYTYSAFKLGTGITQFDQTVQSFVWPVRFGAALTVVKSGTGKGTFAVSSGTLSPSGVALYGADRPTIVVTATPGSDSSFKSWTGCDSSDGTSCTVLMNSGKRVTAEFAMNPVNGLCGDSNGLVLVTQPLTNLCAAGTPTNYSGTGPWSWNCSGIAGGTTSEACVATLRDIIKPVVSAFAIPPLHNNLTIPIPNFTSTDNIGVTSYLVTTTASVPSANDANWSPTVPPTFTFPPTTVSGDYKLYAWVKDAGDNISTSISAPVKLDLDVPLITDFRLASYVNSLVVPVVSFVATDSYGGITGYMVTESSTPPLPDDNGWIPPVQSMPSGLYSPPTFSQTYTDLGSKTEYAWVKDAAGNVSLPATASFAFCTVSASSNANGTITLPGLSTYYCSQNRLYKIAPKPGFKIADVLVDGVSVGKVSDYLFSSMSTPGSQHTISASFEPDPFANWHHVAPGYLHTLAVRADGTMWAWGDNVASQLGDGTTTSRYNPIRVTAYTDWQTAAAGPYHSLARRSNACVYGWGDNTTKQLGGSGSTLPVSLFCGSGSTAPQGGAVEAPAVDVYTAGKVASSPVTSTSYSLVRKTDGKFRYMGASPANTASAFSMIDLVELAAGISHGVAIRADGTIWSWGDNTKGQLGGGTVIYTPNPTLPQPPAPPLQAGTSTNWIQVAAGNAHTVGLQANGTLWTWGDNSRGQMGSDLIPNYYPSPFQIGKGQSWKAIAAGDNHTLALRSDGTIWAFGDNSNGQLGDGSGATTNFPVQVGTDSDWKIISAHGNLSYGIKNNNTLYAWGANSKGQLGDTTIVDKLSPVLVGTNTNSFVIAATSSNGGSISPSGVITAAAGTSKTFSIAPLVGWHIDDVMVDGVSQGTITSHTFSNVIDRHTIAATFAPDATVSHTITATAGIGASISPNGTVVVVGTNTQLFTISPQAGYQISDVSVDGVSQGVITTYQFPSLTDNHTVQVSAVLIDTTVPTGTISINDNALSTNNNVVAVSLSASDTGGNLYQMRFSLDTINWSAWELYAMSKSYTVPAGDGTKNLYVQYRDKAGNVSNTYHGTIILDTLPPTGTIVLNNGAAGATSMTMSASINATDGGSGVAQMQMSWDSITWQPWEEYLATRSVTAFAGNGARTLYVRFKDLAGNVSAVANDSIMLTTNTTGVTKPGDCDNNGTVTIAEVQSAINMFLGLKTVEACVDTDGAGGVSIAEVQKTINSFLGL